MSLRRIVFWILLVNFVLGLIGLSFLAYELRKVFSPGLGWIAFAAWAILISLCNVCIAYWVAEDEEYNSDYDDTRTMMLEERSKTKSEESEPRLRNLITKYEKKGLLNPGLFLEHKIAQKVELGKTREQAITEMEKEESES